MDNASLPDRRRHAGRDEGGVHQGGRLLRAARHRVPRLRRSRSSSRSCWRSACSRRSGERLGITEDENDHACREAWQALDAFDKRPAGEGPRHPRDGRSRGSHRDPGARPAVPLRSGPEPRHPRGVPGARLPDPLDSLDPEGPRVPRSLLQGRARARRHQDAARAQPRVARELLGQQRAEGVGARSSRRTTRTSPCSISRASSAATTRRPTASSTRSCRRRSTPYAALHDIDANKPGGSIKIRVKTYAHSLRLQQERLEDLGATRSAQLARAHRREAARAPAAEAGAARGA